MSQDAGQSPDRKRFDADCLIVGFTGSIGSGCTFLAQGVAARLVGHGHYYRLSQFLREEADKRGIEKTVQNLQSLGDELRLKNGNWILVEKCLDHIKLENERSGFAQDEETVLLIDGIKNGGEVKCLRQFPNFYLISVHADQSTRQGRVVGENAPDPRFRTEEEFSLADRRDEQEDIPHGQEIKRCNYLADIIVDNVKPLPPERQRERNEYFNCFINDYIYPMRSTRKGEKTHDRPPKVEETLMTMAYCVSKRSSCLKRKVGAVVAYVRRIKDEHSRGSQDGSERDLPLQIVSSGYNDIPAGTPCVFSPWRGCYRDHLLEDHSKVVKCCPNCGAALPDKLRCPHCGTENEVRPLQCTHCDGDLLSDYTCQKCGYKVFGVCLPGKEGIPGKLLDMCRSLHAEENAILGLSGIAKSDRGELVMYTTTFPCNRVCENKLARSAMRHYSLSIKGLQDKEKAHE